jgi:hypothetical protein
LNDSRLCAAGLDPIIEHFFQHILRELRTGRQIAEQLQHGR